MRLDVSLSGVELISQGAERLGQALAGVSQTEDRDERSFVFRAH